MSAVTGVGLAPVYERPDPVKQHLDVAREGEKREKIEAADKENIQVLQERREQIKAPVNKGEGTLVDKEV
ncbi:hypothetical protein [uncultured Maritalea sp.]|jgi:CCR4-NOT transcriptional regulation complex NOT5 subunit|uniref:hypothetical protein n=1 Tax=uncultured Maritalea sp. TaxID=757249 RepID=UPI002612D88E|nr:hypothetical protein [uncultured Maritalea sp.]